MSSVNDPKSTDNQSSSPIRNLFRKDQNSYNENDEQEEKEEEAEDKDNTTETDNRLKNRLKKMTSGLDKIISIMSQPIEYTSYDDDDEDANDESTENEQPEIKSDNDNVHTVADQEVEASQKTTKDSHNQKKKETEFIFEDIFADADKSKISSEEQPNLITEEKGDKIQEGNNSESKEQKKPESRKTESVSEKIQPNDKTIAAENKKKENNQALSEENVTEKTKAAEPQKTVSTPADKKKTEPKPNSKPQKTFLQEMTMERLWEELPEYNIFEDSEPTKSGDIKESAYIEETISKLQEMPLGQSKLKNTSKPADTQQKDSEKSEQDDLTEIGQSPEEKLEDKDLTEGNNSSFIYHYSETTPFIVMAGKFTKTLRIEYQAIRDYRNSDSSKTLENSGSNKKEALEVNITVQDKKSTTGSQKTESSEKKQTAKEEGTILPTVEKQPESLSSEDEKTKKEKRKKEKFKKEKKPFPKLSFRDFIGSVDDSALDDDFEESKPKRQLDDYNEEKDAEEIKTEIGANMRLVFTRTIILLATTVISIITAIIGQFTPLFSESMRTGWLFYAIINFSLFTISAITARLPIVNGLMPLRHFKGNSDTAVAVASFAVAIQSITAIFTPHVFTNGTYHIYVPIVSTALLFNSFGKLLIILRARDNFKFLIKPYPKYAGKIYTDEKNAEKMVSELPSKKAIIGYTKRSKFMSNFLQLSYAPDSSEKLAAKAAPITTVISLALGILYGIVNFDFAGGATSFALTACIGIPMICLLALNIPMKILCKNVLNEGAMVSGYDAVKQFCDTNVIMVDSSQLYPKGTVILSGMKVFKQSGLNEAMQDGAAIMYAVNGTMSYVFENIVQCRKEVLPKVDSVVYEDGKGLLAWVNKQRVLIGNRELLESHNIKVPNKELEDRYFKIGCEITYVSVSGELIAMFILSYKADREIVNELRNLQENGVSFIIRTVDPNITKEKTARKFGLFHRCVTILPTGLGNICHEVTSGTEERSRAYLVTRGKLSSFAKAISWCIKMKSTITLSKILQYICIGFGLLIFTFISFVSGFEKLGNIEILLYLMFWAVTTIAVSLIIKK